MNKLKAYVHNNIYSAAYGQSVIDLLGGGISFLRALNDEKYTVFPGFCDVHVHFREPGFSYKETIKTGSESAASGGYTAVCTMPNLSPVPDCKEGLQVQKNVIARDSVIHVYPYGAITRERKGEVLSDMDGIADGVIAFSDDGSGVQNDSMMRSAMLKAKSLGKMIVAHCEDESMLHGGYIHDGAYAREHGHKGISSESEWKQLERDLRLVRETGCRYHMCHISTKESVELLRSAKAEGLDVSGETAPHYLIFDDSMLCEEGRFKMNPPIRSVQDRDALTEAVLDGTIEIIATDHAPHSAEEKAKGLEKSAFGIVGLETAFAALYTHLVKPGIMTLDRLVELMAVNPRTRFGIPIQNDFTVWELNGKYTVNPDKFKTMGRATPFEGMMLSGKCMATVCGGKPVYIRGEK